MIGIRVFRLKRRLQGRISTLRVYGWRDLPSMRRLFSAEVLHRAGGYTDRPFKGILSFGKWVRSTFMAAYLIEGSENGGRRRTIGFAGLYNVKPGESLWLSLLIFDPRDRNRGYGRDAFELLSQHLADQGMARVLRVETLMNNRGALEFLIKMGFRIRATIENRVILERESTSM